MHSKIGILGIVGIVGIVAIAGATAFATTVARGGRVTTTAAPPGVRAPQLVIVTRDAVVATRARGRVDGAFHLRGAGLFLLLRAASGRDGFLDAVYHVHHTRLERIHVRGPFGDGLTTAYMGTTYIDIDCGPAARTLVQVIQQPLPQGGWRRTLITFTLHGRWLTLTKISHAIVTGAEAGHRRCNIARR